MSAIQGWALLLLLAGLAARGFDGPRLTLADLRYLAAPAVIAVLQRITEDQVTLDDPFLGPMILAVPVIAALRDGVRTGMATALGTWLLLVVLGGAVPAGGSNDLPQETFQLATCFAVVLSGAAGSLPPARRWLGVLAPLGWCLFFGVRDPRLLLSPTLMAIPMLAAGWTGIAIALRPGADPAPEAVG